MATDSFSPSATDYTPSGRLKRLHPRFQAQSALIERAKTDV